MFNLKKCLNKFNKRLDIAKKRNEEDYKDWLERMLETLDEQKTLENINDIINRIIYEKENYKEAQTQIEKQKEIIKVLLQKDK